MNDFTALKASVDANTAQSIATHELIASLKAAIATAGTDAEIIEAIRQQVEAATARLASA